MKVLIDTNIIIDVLANRANFVKDSKRIFDYSETKEICGYISAMSIPNIVYILRNELDKDTITDIIEKLNIIFEIIELNKEDLKQASKLGFADYEDAIQSYQASRIKADYIVTRNIKDFNSRKIKAITPTELLLKIENKWKNKKSAKADFYLLLSLQFVKCKDFTA